MLPQITSTDVFLSNSNNKLLILAEGFEARSLSWINNEKNKILFSRAIICKYLPHTETRFNQVLEATKKHCFKEPEIMNFDRFSPAVFEKQILNLVNECKEYEEIIIDISVMSKLLIMIILYSLKEFNGNISIIYSEPETWGPSEEKYEKALLEKKIGSWISLSSVGVSDVVKTPNLSSIVMQNNPTLLITFLSFNEQLFGALINQISPTKLQIINHSCLRQDWREQAIMNIHNDVISEYFGKDFEITFSADVLDYVAVFEKLAKIYEEHCYDFRVIISPTGGKIHTIAAALFKLCCPDVHVEYPTPESYLFEEYSSEKIYAIHRIVFEKFNSFLFKLSNKYGLNG
jgi:hypothetical protein